MTPTRSISKTILVAACAVMLFVAPGDVAAHPFAGQTHSRERHPGRSHRHRAHRPAHHPAAAFARTTRGTGAAPTPVPRLAASLTSKPANPTTSSAAALTFTATLPSTFTCSLDGSASTPCTSPVAYSGLRPGTHSFALTAHAKTGSATTSYSWTVSASATPTPLGVPGNWTLKFDDEFSGPSLDLTKWQPDWLGPSNTSITRPDNSNDLNCMDPAQVSVGGGFLHLTAQQRPCTANNGTTYAYASGLVNSAKTFTFSYGYAEARIYLPMSPTGAPVNFPAFWTDGTGRWPTTGEMDVIEVLHDCGAHPGFHFISTLGNPGSCSAVPNAGGWHTYGAQWEPGIVNYFYDGQYVGSVNQGITGFPMYLILNNSVDPTWGGPTLTPADMLVDYVRVWQ